MLSIEPPIVGNPKPIIQIDCEPKKRLSPITIFSVLTISAIYGDLLHSCGSVKTCTGKCLEVNQRVMLKVALGGLHGDLRGGKEGRKGMKIGSMRRKGSLASEKGHFKRTRQCLAFRGVIVLIEGIRSSSEGTRN